MFAGEYEKALDNIKQSITLDQSNKDSVAFWPYYRQQGIVNYGMGEFEKALNDFQYAIELETKYRSRDLPSGTISIFPSETYRWVVYANDMMKKKSSAQPLLTMNNGLDGLISHAQNDKGFDGDEYIFRTSIGYHEWKERSIDDFTEILNSWKKHPVYYYYRGLRYAKNNEYEKAIADFAFSIEKYDSLSSQSYYARGLIHYGNNRYDNALTDFLEALNPWVIEHFPILLVFFYITKKALKGSIPAC